MSNPAYCLTRAGKQVNGRELEVVKLRLAKEAYLMHA